MSKEQTTDANPKEGGGGEKPSGGASDQKPGGGGSKQDHADRQGGEKIQKLGPPEPWPERSDNKDEKKG